MAANDMLRSRTIPLNHGHGAIPALGFGTLIPDPVATRSATKGALEAGFRALGYDALGRRVTESDSTNSQSFYYNGDQMIESVPQSGATVCHEQFVYGLDYIDDVVLRDRDADSSTETGSLGAIGSGLEERLYYTHDRQYSVTGLVSQSGTMLERTVTILTASASTSVRVMGRRVRLRVMRITLHSLGAG